MEIKEKNIPQYGGNQCKSHRRWAADQSRRLIVIVRGGGGGGKCLQQIATEMEEEKNQ